MTQSRSMSLPAHCIYLTQLDGQGGMVPLGTSLLSSAPPTWVHLDYRQPDVAHWLSTTPLLNEAARMALLGQSSRPKLMRQGDNLLLILRGINHNQGQSPEEMVALRIFINPQLILTSRGRPLLSEQDVYASLQDSHGPTNAADWLIEMCDALTDRAGEFVDDLHEDILTLEEVVLEQGNISDKDLNLGRIRKQLIIIRRYLSPQRDLIARLASEKIDWLDDNHRRRLQDIAERLRRWLDDLDAGVARTTVLADEINNMMSQATHRRTYQISVMALIFLPTTFLTGLFGVNLGGIPGAEHPFAFWIFCTLLLIVMGGLFIWLRLRHWW